MKVLGNGGRMVVGRGQDRVLFRSMGEVEVGEDKWARAKIFSVRSTYMCVSVG